MSYGYFLAPLKDDGLSSLREVDSDEKVLCPYSSIEEINGLILELYPDSMYEDWHIRFPAGRKDLKGVVRRADLCFEYRITHLNVFTASIDFVFGRQNISVVLHIAKKLKFNAFDIQTGERIV